jgi:hypothetical protein
MVKAALDLMNAETALRAYCTIISSLYNLPSMDDIYQITDEAIKPAAKWQNRANELRTPRERARQH